MKDVCKEMIELLERYQMDTGQILRDYSDLDYLYALSDMRENVLEWYPFRQDATLLQVGSDYGALTGLYSRRVNQVVVLDPSEDNLTVNRMRHQYADNIEYINGELAGLVNRGSESSAYDYVVMVGSLEPEFETQIQIAKSLLKPGGELIVAVCNRFGMKYWAGAEKDLYSFSIKEVTRLLAGDDEAEQNPPEVYYPMPDYKLATTIYSQNYLPVKGDLTQTITAYDYPKYLLLDVGAAYDEVCEDGQFENFANSFLMIWRNHGSN